MAWTLCKQCNKKERYHEGGKVHPYCGKTCAEEAIGRKIGQPQQNAKLSNNAMIQEEDTSWMGSNYMALAGISHEEMWEEAASLGFVAAPVNAADEGSIYSPGMVDLLQSMGFIFMNEFSESEPSEIEDAAQVSEDFSEIEEAALNEVSEIGEVEGEGVQLDLQDDNWIRVPPQFNRRECGEAKEEMKDPFAPGAGYYSVLDNAEAHDGYRITYYHDKIPVAFDPVLERVQKVHDACFSDYLHEEIPTHSEKQHKLWPVFQSWKYHAGIRPARDDGKSLLKWLRWRSRKRKKFKKKYLLDDLYHHWLQTEVQDVNLYMPDSEVDAYNDAQYGLQPEAQDGHLYMSDPDAPGIKCRRAKKTVRAIDEVYLCEEVARNRVSGFRSLSDASLQRILETNGMETRTRGSTRWTSHLRARRRRAIGKYLRIQESLQEAEGILLRRNEHMDAAATWANERWHDLEMGTLFAFDENWANRAWTDLELFTTMESNDISSNNLQAGRNPVSQREKLSDCVVPLAMPESEWDRHGMQTMGPQRRRNHVQDIDLHKCISLSESEVQVPLTAAYEDVAADDEIVTQMLRIIT